MQTLVRNLHVVVERFERVQASRDEIFVHVAGRSVAEEGAASDAGIDLYYVTVAMLVMAPLFTSGNYLLYKRKRAAGSWKSCFSAQRCSAMRE